MFQGHQKPETRRSLPQAPVGSRRVGGSLRLLQLRLGGEVLGRLQLLLRQTPAQLLQNALLHLTNGQRVITYDAPFGGSTQGVPPILRPTAKWQRGSTVGSKMLAMVNFMAMGHNLWLHFGAEHPCTTYVNVHQGYRVLAHSQMAKGGADGSKKLAFLLVSHERRRHLTTGRGTLVASKKCRLLATVNCWFKTAPGPLILSFAAAPHKWPGTLVCT